MSSRCRVDVDVDANDDRRMAKSWAGGALVYWVMVGLTSGATVPQVYGIQDQRGYRYVSSKFPFLRLAPPPPPDHRIRLAAASFGTTQSINASSLRRMDRLSVWATVGAPLMLSSLAGHTAEYGRVSPMALKQTVIWSKGVHP